MKIYSVEEQARIATNISSLIITKIWIKSSITEIQAPKVTELPSTIRRFTSRVSFQRAINSINIREQVWRQTVQTSLVCLRLQTSEEWFIVIRVASIIRLTLSEINSILMRTLIDLWSLGISSLKNARL